MFSIFIQGNHGKIAEQIRLMTGRIPASNESICDHSPRFDVGEIVQTGMNEMGACQFSQKWEETQKRGGATTWCSDRS
jgi:hypothetical protein